MSLNAMENSRYKGKPINLYLFTFGDGPNDYYGYTTADTQIIYGGHVFETMPITRDSVTASGKLDKAEMTVKTDVVTGAARLFANWAPSSVVQLTIFQGHAGDLNFQVCWAGRITSVSRANGEVSFGAEPVTTSLSRLGLRRNYQYGCPHVLYGHGCFASEAAGTVTATVSAVATPTVTLNAGWNGAKDRTRFINGKFEWVDADGRTNIRAVLALVSDNKLRLNGKVNNLLVGQTVKVKLGCRHDMADCEETHNNILNYGGQPWIPTSNPTGIKNNFY
ncbi:hypothetical protein AEAC466_04280 [Asticcacaulis sp. AC466]|uniref:phage BR0599 family protein n=1 Tax=Asticcacaulis sp. AC466 TaxID=1282362 RepID=UPI0003C40680|nr:phage BR0599 family protein [Asticcacaulis sp. AC466]ESQ85391.1 hypothetical protein AEAC466_04280 [Asticcacaulis sp. AC466]